VTAPTCGSYFPVTGRFVSDLQSRITDMARSVQDQPVGNWPAWSTGESLMVALVLNDSTALRVLGYTICEAFDRVDLTAGQLRAIEREVR
jgi:hypothetical protein